MTKNAKFISNVTMIHMVTYILCGMVFSTVFNYKELFTLGNAQYFMRDFGGASTFIGPVVQVVRGILYGIVLLLFKESFMNKNHAVAKLWAILVIIGIINTPGPSPFSIEGVVYTKLPLAFHLKGAPEILIQTLLFSYFVVNMGNGKKRKVMPAKYKKAFIIMGIAAIGFSVAGMITALVLGVDVMAGMEDPFAFVVMLAAMGTTFAMTLWYEKNPAQYSRAIYIGVCYSAIAIMPTLYNSLTQSPFESYLPLLIGIIPTVIIAKVAHRP